MYYPPEQFKMLDEAHALTDSLQDLAPKLYETLNAGTGRSVGSLSVGSVLGQSEQYEYAASDQPAMRKDLER